MTLRELINHADDETNFRLCGLTVPEQLRGRVFTRTDNDIPELNVFFFRARDYNEIDVFCEAIE